MKLLLPWLCWVLLLPLPAAADSSENDRVLLRGQLDDDYYAAGGTIDIDAAVDGDVVAAGGELFIGNRIAGDLIAAGGRLRVRGRVDDDVRISGGELDLDVAIGDDLAASGGSIKLATGSSIGGDAWLIGGKLDIGGVIEGDLKAYGGEILLSATVRGDVELEGGEIRILDGARIGGNLDYVSPREADTGSDASVDGRINYEQGEPEYADRGFGLFFSITLVVSSILFYLLFPHYTVASVRRIGTDPFASLGLGFVFVVVTPLVAMVLMQIVLGLWVGLSLLALYCVALLCGLLIACFFVAERGAGLFGQDLSSRSRRLISVVIAIFVLGLVQTIPLLGGLLLLLLLLLGLGAGLIQLRYVYRNPADAA